ncbi:MAG: AI-2E family transporter [Brucellaceae bacterium]|nr:AI-2E family transporter [Brucellaceae bacterium]MCO5057925.1 AI-2E family transporter [Rhizobiaceae bacterium]
MPKRDRQTEVLTEIAAGAAIRRQIVFWLLAAVVFIAFVYVFSSILLPFVAGMVLAYFLDPVADRLERLGLSRTAATLVILFAFIVGFTLVLMILIPVVATQLADLIGRMPDYIARLQDFVTSIDESWLERVSGMDMESLRSGINNLLTQGAGFLTTLFESIWNSGRALVDIAGLFVVTPVVAFYMLLDWDRMVAKVDSWVPRDHVDTVRQIANDINRSTAGFVRGQGTLCLVLGVLYAIALTATGLNFGLAIGLIAGLISFIPYVGSIVGFGLSMGVALVQFWPQWPWILVVAGIFFAGQMIEGYILQPRLIGRSVGLHPVWLMFALFAFGYLFGFVGLLIAVPAAAAIAVLIRFALDRYLASPLYHGHGQDDGAR